MAKKTPFADVSVSKAIRDAYRIITHSDISIVRDLCTKPVGRSRTEANILRITRKVGRTRSKAAQLEALLRSPASPERATKLLRMYERSLAEEIKRCANNRRKVFGPRGQQYDALAHELLRLSAVAEPIQPSTRVVIDVAMLYAKDSQKTAESLCDTYFDIENETIEAKQAVEDAIVVFGSSRDRDEDTYRQAQVMLFKAEKFVKEEAEHLETRAQNLAYELMAYDNQLIKLLLNSDQQTRREIGKLIFPEEFAEK